jgi:hypothetical protein
MTGGDDYYWASGEKIPLDTAPQIAVNTKAADEHGLWQGELSDTATAKGTDIGRGLVILPSDAVPSGLRDRLDSTGASAPVYRADDALIVVLPEVRMESSKSSAHDVRTAVERIDSDASVEESAPGRFVVKPSSGRGEDALHIANRLTEDVSPEAVQPRFVRIAKPQPD